jgi:hypothetical protein
MAESTEEKTEKERGRKIQRTDKEKRDYRKTQRTKYRKTERMREVNRGHTFLLSSRFQ